ncbi:MAG: hypothetical protein VX768_21450, partial [Planctomycetota bacterium]|nr:hypothetical protein [Planctomycetota bacterium]
QVAEEVVSRSYYRLDVDPPSGAVASILQATGEFLQWCLKPFEGVFDWIEGLPAAVRNLLVIVLLLVVIALLVHIVYSIVSAAKRKKMKVQLDDAHTQEHSASELERNAMDCSSAGEWVLAIRYLYRAAIIRICKKEENRIGSGMTNREQLMRLRNTPFFEPIRILGNMVEQKWYGEQACTGADFEVCHRAHQQIRDLL